MVEFLIGESKHTAVEKQAAFGLVLEKHSSFTGADLPVAFPAWLAWHSINSERGLGQFDIGSPYPATLQPIHQDKIAIHSQGS